MSRLLAVAFLFTLISGGAVAAPFSVSYVGTIEAGAGGAPGFTNMVDGETYKVTLVMDNGGNSSQSQTWVASDLVSTKWEFNDSRNVVFEQDINTSYGIYNVDGNATTDANGALTAFFSEVQSGGAVFDAVGLPDLVSPAEWYMNGNNGVFYSDGCDGGCNYSPGMNDAAGGLDMGIASWSNPVAVASVSPASASPSVPVPTLPTILLMALSGLLALFGFYRVRASK